MKITERTFTGTGHYKCSNSIKGDHQNFSVIINITNGSRIDFHTGTGYGRSFVSRNNIDVYVLYKFANVKMVIEKIFEEVSSLLTEQQFEELYKHATSEPYNALVIDNHPKTERDKRFKKNFDVVLTHGT